VRQEKQTAETILLLSSSKIYFKSFPGEGIASLTHFMYTFNSAADLDSCTLIYMCNSSWSKIWNTVNPHNNLEPLFTHPSQSASLNVTCPATGRHSLHGW